MEHRITQIVGVLFDRWPQPVAVRERLEPLGDPTRREQGQDVVLSLPLGDAGEVVVDTLRQPWPDEPVDDDDPVGPVHPGSLARAVQHSWAWKHAPLVVPRHQAVARVRCLGGDPVGVRDPVRELVMVTRVAAALLDVSGALCWFAARGEALRSGEVVRGAMRRIGPGPVPIDLWTNVRLLGVDPDWRVVDTVGMEQLELPDLEACHAEGAYDHREVDAFLRNLQLYLVDRGEVIGDGDSMPGPGGARWSARAFPHSLAVPPRRVLRLFPHDQTQPPAALL